MDSEFKDYLQEFIFNAVDMTVKDIKIEGVDASTINKYIRAVEDERIDFDRINFMDEGLLNVGTVDVIDRDNKP